MSRKRAACSNGNFNSYRIEDVKHDHVGAAIAEVLQAVEHRRRIVEQIRDEHHHAALSDGGRQIVQRLRHVGARAHLQPLERQQHHAQVARPRARRQQRGNAVVERDQAERITLPVHQVGQRAGEVRRVLQLGDRTRRVAHRRADVDQQVTREVGFFLVLLDEVAIRSRVDLPVQRGQVVAGQVLPVFGELDAEPLERTAMQAGQEPFDDRPRLEVDGTEPGDDRRIEIPCFTSHVPSNPCPIGVYSVAYRPLAGNGTASSSWSTMRSAVMPSASA